VPVEVRSLGVLGGTFNPPHLGHLALARHALEELALERVLMMPAHIPPHKASEEDPGSEHRLRMCRLCVAGTAGLLVSALEMERGGRSYTVDTLESIHASHPQAELTFIVGADTANTLPSWREPERLLELADLAVAGREGPGPGGVLQSLAPLLAVRRSGEGDEAIRFLDMPAVRISSSMVRERVARGDQIEDLVGPAVAAYIAEQGLYRSHTGALS
jgi:nicotinate-nucleotide adenylyltransferase